MTPERIIDAPERRFIGLSSTMSLEENKTRELWSSFGPRHREIQPRYSTAFYSIQIYTGKIDFTPSTIFTKWATIEVYTDTPVPEGMKALTIPAGQYAIFIHNGPSANFPQTMTGIFNWLATENQVLDDRPYFEAIPPDYPGPDSEEAQEEIWIPIKPCE